MLTDLNAEQYEAATTLHQRALVLAGAGSGKTRTLVERIAYLVEKRRVNPSEIMAITFTRKAAGEMVKRLSERIGLDAHKIKTGTIHAIALKYLKSFGDIIGLWPSKLTVYGDWEEQFLMRDVATRLRYYRNGKWRIPKKKIDQMMAQYYQTGDEPEKNHEAYKLFAEFMTTCRENNSLTYGALLTGLDMLVPHIAKFHPIQHLLVDEVQDIDTLQWWIIKKLVTHNVGCLFAVGDIDQSIYEFRGADPGYLIRNKKEFKVYRLETNYRSDGNIVSAANHLIENNVSRIPKTMVAFEDKQTDVEVPENMDSAAIVSMIKKMNASAPLAKRAVLARTHALLKKLSKLLTQEGILHNYVGQKTGLIRSEEFRRVNAYIKLLVNPHDNFSFLLVRDTAGIPPEKYQRIREEARVKGASQFEMWQEMDPEIDFFQRVAGHRLAVDDLAYHLRESIDWPFDVEPIIKFIQEEPPEIMPPEKYLEWVATYDLQDEIKTDNDGPGRLQLMTIHAAKGLEWPTVIVAGVNEGLLPSKQALKNDELESERRLAYVAWTRAEDKLILAVRPEHSTGGNGREYHNTISRFIYESMLGEEE